MPYEVGQSISIKWNEFGFAHAVYGQSGILAKIDHERSEQHTEHAIYYIVFQNGVGYWASPTYMKPYRRE